MTHIHYLRNLTSYKNLFELIVARVSNPEIASVIQYPRWVGEAVRVSDLTAGRHVVIGDARVIGGQNVLSVISHSVGPWRESRERLRVTCSLTRVNRVE